MKKIFLLLAVLMCISYTRAEAENNPNLFMGHEKSWGRWDDENGYVLWWYVKDMPFTWEDLHELEFDNNVSLSTYKDWCDKLDRGIEFSKGYGYDYTELWAGIKRDLEQYGFVHVIFIDNGVYTNSFRLGLIDNIIIDRSFYGEIKEKL